MRIANSNTTPCVGNSYLIIGFFYYDIVKYDCGKQGNSNLTGEINIKAFATVAWGALK